MSTIYRPPHVHHCTPGWTWTPGAPDGPFSGKRLGTPPTTASHPPGTVWQCPDCEQCWVSHRAPAMRGLTIDRVVFRRESRFARWRRDRRTTKDSTRKG